MILTYVCAGAAIACFFALLQLLGVVGEARRAIAASRDAMNTLNNASISDDEKERAAQAASLRLFGHFLQIALRSAAALAAPTLALYAADRAGLISFNDVMTAMMSWPFIVSTCVVAMLVLAFMRRRRP
jgi:hypothetical protein